MFSAILNICYAKFIVQYVVLFVVIGEKRGNSMSSNSNLPLYVMQHRYCVDVVCCGLLLVCLIYLKTKTMIWELFSFIGRRV